MIGQTLMGRYYIDAELGRGAMGIVYRAVDRKYQRYVAIKTMFATLAEDPEFLRRFQREAEALSRLDHPNVVHLYKWFREDGNYYMVIEYVDGQPLSKIMRGHRPLPLGQAVEWFKGIAAGLAHAHSRGVIHRDVTDGNILISSHGQPKVSDFGIARLVKTTIYQRTGSLGTPVTVSPEVIKNQPATERSDIYSLAVVFYEMLTGQPPFWAEVPEALLNMHLTQQPPSLRRLNPAVPPALEKVVLRALAKDPQKRYPSVAAFSQAVQSALSSRPAPGPKPIVPIGVGAVMLVVVLLATLLATLINPASCHSTLTSSSTPTTAVVPGRTTVVPTTTRLTATTLAANAPVTPSPTAVTPQPGITPTPGATATPAPPPPPPALALLAFTVTEKFREVYHIELMNSDGSNRHTLVNMASEPSFSPDGRQVVYYGWPGGLHVINVDGSGDHIIVNDGEAAFPAWSPDGRFIAFHSVRGWSSRFDIYVVNADGSGERKLVDGEMAAWSPDGQQIVYKGCLGNECGLMIVNADGSGKRRLTMSPNDGLADWSRDNNRIVFTSERDGNHEIYVMNPDGSNQTRLTNHPGPDALPVWLPGGRQIAFRSARDGSWGIYIMKADGSDVHKIADARVDPNHWIWEKMAATRR